jgi:hypothetical protein
MSSEKQKWFVFCDDDMHFVDSEQQAVDAAKDAIDECRAQSDEQWVDEVNHICYGIVVGESRSKDAGEHGEYYDFTIEKIDRVVEQHALLLEACESAMRIERLWCPSGPLIDPDREGEDAALHAMREMFLSVIAMTKEQ